MIMQNTLKSETTPVISALHTANIRTVMITGKTIIYYWVNLLNRLIF